MGQPRSGDGTTTAFSECCSEKRSKAKLDSRRAGGVLLVVGKFGRSVARVAGGGAGAGDEVTPDQQTTVLLATVTKCGERMRGGGVRCAVLLL